MSLRTPEPAAPGAPEPETAAATAERHDAAASEDARAARKTGIRSALELVISPVVAVTAAVVAVVVMNGDLDDIEARALATDEVLRRVGQHLDMSVRAVALIILIAVPLGVLFSRPAFGRVRGGLVSFLTFAQALPPLGVMFLLPSFMGFGLRTAVTAIVIAAVLPVLRNVLVGLEQVDSALIEASRGMGMSNLQTLLKVELPLAVPVIVTGIRVSLVLAVGAAVFGAFINAGGLGYLIDTGQKLARDDITLVGALLVASLALTVDWLSAVAQRVLRPRGV